MKELILRPSTFASLRDLLRDAAGIELEPGKEALVKARLYKKLDTLGLDDVEGYLEHLRADRSGRELEALLDLITTNKTSFFREPRAFEILRAASTEWAMRAEPARVWSAGCSSGEEPWSVAMTFADAHGTRGGAPRILATDVSNRVLKIARSGDYPAASAVDVPLPMRQRWLLHSTDGSRVSIAPELRSLVSFARLNFINPWPMRGPFDAILCRNVMIYFNSTVRRALIARFREFLQPGGWFFVGRSESLQGIEHELEFVEPGVYRR